MHARIDHLLSLRDGEPVDVAVRTHVEVLRRVRTGAGEARARAPSAAGAAAASRTCPPADGIACARASRRRSHRRRRAAGRGRRRSRLLLRCWVAGRHVAARRRIRRTGAGCRAGCGRRRDHTAYDRGPAATGRACSRKCWPHCPRAPRSSVPGRRMPIETLEAQVQWLDHQLSMSGVADARAGAHGRAVARAGRTDEHTGPAALCRGAAGRAVSRGVVRQRTRGNNSNVDWRFCR